MLSSQSLRASGVQVLCLHDPITLCKVFLASCKNLYSIE